MKTKKKKGKIIMQPNSRERAKARSQREGPQWELLRKKRRAGASAAVDLSLSQCEASLSLVILYKPKGKEATCVRLRKKKTRPSEERYIIRSSSQVNKGHNRFSSQDFLIQFIPKRNLTCPGWLTDVGFILFYFISSLIIPLLFCYLFTFFPFSFSFFFLWGS